MLDYLLALSPLAGLLLNSLSLLLLYRLYPAQGLLRSEYLCFGVGAVVVLSVNLFVCYLDPVWEPLDLIGHIFLTNLSYAALGYCHFHFVNLGETARRIRLLRELHQSGGSLSHNDLLTRYNAQEIVEKRISRLMGAGQIVLRDGRYYIGNKTVVRIAVIMTGLKMLLLGKQSEYDN